MIQTPCDNSVINTYIYVHIYVHGGVNVALERTPLLTAHLNIFLPFYSRRTLITDCWLGCASKR